MREYVWLGDQIIAVIANANTSPVIYYVTNDHLGRPVQMTDAAQAVVWRAKYKPFGEVSAITGTASLDYRWPGQWFQLESGLAYNWHRHYDPTLGRYTQPDPLGHPDGPSVYGYVGQNPAGGVDPEGLQLAIPGPVAGPWLAACLANPACAGAAAGALIVGGCIWYFSPSDDNNNIVVNATNTNADCEAAKGKASSQAAILEKRIREYLAAGTSADRGHYNAIQQAKVRLRNLIQSVKRACHSTPPEISEWERLIGTSVPAPR